MQFTKKQFIWGIILYGTLIGLNESIIGSLSIPYRSVVLSSITIALLSFARFQFPKIGTSLLIIAVALLFKVNSAGLHTCTMSYMFCGPTALLLLGIGYELFASVIIRKNSSRIYLRIVLCSILTALIMFASFALFQIHIVKDPVWTNKFNDYVFFKGPLTAAVSSIISVLGLLLIKRLTPAFINIVFKKPVVSQVIMGFFIAAMWVIGYVII